jgi:DNA-binding protein HU-beta
MPRRQFPGDYNTPAVLYGAFLPEGSCAFSKLRFLAKPVAAAKRSAKNSFTIPGLGKIVLVNRKARMGRNTATGATIKIAAKRVVKFRVAKAAKDAILGAK